MPAETEHREEIKNMDEFFEENGNPFSAKPEEKKPEEEKKKEEEININSEEEDEDKLELERKPEQKKNTPEESNSILKKNLNEAKSKLQKYEETLGSHSPETLKPLIDFITSKSENGIVDADVITNTISELQELQEENETLKGKLTEKDKLLERADIQQSTEFQEKFDKPLREAKQALLLEFAQVSQGNIIGPESTKAFNDYLLKAAEKPNALEIKEKLQEFVVAYEKETGEKPINLPSVSNLVKSVREYGEAGVSYLQAYNNWTETKKKTQEEENQNRLVQSQQQQKQNKQLRKNLTSKAFTEYDLDGAYSFLDEKEVKGIFESEYKNGEILFSDPDKIPSYDVMITRGVESELWRKYAPMLKEIIEQKQLEEEGQRQRPGNKSQAQPGNRKADDVDWIDMK